MEMSPDDGVVVPPIAHTAQQVVKSSSTTVEVFSDADWASSKTDYGSTTGVALKWCGMLIDVCSNTQPGLPALSSGEAELRALSRAVVEAIHLKSILLEAGEPNVRLLVRTDATAALGNAAKLGPRRMKHLMVCATFVKTAVRRRIVQLLKVDTSENYADAMTKHVKQDILDKLWLRMGLEGPQHVPDHAPVTLRRLNALKGVETFEKGQKGRIKAISGDVPIECVAATSCIAYGVICAADDLVRCCRRKKRRSRDKPVQASPGVAEAARDVPEVPEVTVQRTSHHPPKTVFLTKTGTKCHFFPDCDGLSSARQVMPMQVCLHCIKKSQ